MNKGWQSERYDAKHVETTAGMLKLAATLLGRSWIPISMDVRPV